MCLGEAGAPNQALARTQLVRSPWAGGNIQRTLLSQLITVIRRDQKTKPADARQHKSTCHRVILIESHHVLPVAVQYPQWSKPFKVSGGGNRVADCHQTHFYVSLHTISTSEKLSTIFARGREEKAWEGVMLTGKDPIRGETVADPSNQLGFSN